MEYHVIRNYCFLNGKWHHMIRKLNKDGMIITQVMTSSTRMLHQFIKVGA